jgi:hypothetical protein
MTSKKKARLGRMESMAPLVPPVRMDSPVQMGRTGLQVRTEWMGKTA